MNPIRWARLRVRAIVARRRIERDMHEEMREHLERATERLIERGIPEKDARLAARREFGNLTMLQAESRDARGGRWVDALSGDTRFALRYFLRHKATTAIVVAVIALATGADTLIFSIFQAQFLRPAPAVPHDRSQVRLWMLERPTRTARWGGRGFTGAYLDALAARREVFRDVAAWTEDEVILRADSAAARGVGAQFVTPNFFGALGVRPVAGRELRPATADGPDMTAVMSHDMATQLYGDARQAVGRRILVNELPVLVIGVAPPLFQGAVPDMRHPALWLPVSARADIARLSPRWRDETTALAPFARLAPGASRERATLLAQQLADGMLPDSASRVGLARRAHVLAMLAPPPGDEGAQLVLAFAVVSTIGVLILLVGWTNVSSLMVAAAVARRHEIAVRLSLGASRLRLVRQLLTESVMLALSGSAIGLALAWAVLRYMMTTELSGVDLMPDAGTFAFVLALALATGVLFGLSPALHATRGAVATAIRDSGAGTSGRSRLQRGFVVAQIALSQPLLVVLGTMLALVFSQYQPMAPEVSRRIVAVQFRPVENGGPGQRPADVDALVPRLAARPGVRAAVPEATAFAIRGVVAPARGGVRADSVPTILHLEGAAPGWFALLDVPIEFGRDVALSDTAAADYPVVVGSALARKLWGEGNPVGRTIASPPLPGLGQDSVTLTVVGVYGAPQRIGAMTWQGQTTRGSNNVDRVYTARGRQWRHDRVLVRTGGPAEPLLADLRRFVRAEVPSLPVTSMMTVAQEDRRQYEESLAVAGLATAGGVLALLLASLGLYGVVSLAVRQRTREIGIRIAVGAHPMRVARMFLASGVRASLVALALGLPLSIVGLRFALRQGAIIAPEVNPVAIGIAIALVLLAVASGATWVPARRAAMVDPARTLRVE